MAGTSYLIIEILALVYLGMMRFELLTDPKAQIDQYPPGNWVTIIENQTFTETLQLDTGDDDTLIINATFHNIDGNAIMIRNVKNVYIKNCKIFDVTGDGIVLRSTGSSQNVTIDGCTIYNIARNGIIAKQHSNKDVNHPQLIIKNNTIYNTGTSQLDHNIYVQTTDSLIENNVLHGSAGHGVSIRSSGIVRGNQIWDTQKSCIRYFSDNFPGPSETLTIENNICYQTDAGADSPGISLLKADRYPDDWLLQNYRIRFNTVILFSADRFGIAVESKEFDDKNVEVYGNLLVNTQDISATLKPQYIDYLSGNYISTSLAGFVNATVAPYDFRITAVSPARYVASTVSDFPPIDIDGANRNAEYLDAGAYQFSSGPAVTPPISPGATDIPLATPSPTNSNPPQILKETAQPVSSEQNPLPTPGQNTNVGNTGTCFSGVLGLLLMVGIGAVIRIRNYPNNN